MGNKHELLFAQMLFGPSKVLTEINRNSILSFADYAKAHYDELPNMRCVFAGWARTDEYFEMLLDAAKQVPLPTEVIRAPGNFGKACVINSVVNPHLAANPQVAWLYTSDSDMYFLQDQDWFFQRLKNSLRQTEAHRTQPGGLIAPWMDENDCHLHQYFPHRMSTPFKAPNGRHYQDGVTHGFAIGGVAGGAILVDTDGWKQVGGYRKFNRPYAGDDGYLMHDLFHAHRFTVISDSVHIKHLKEGYDPEYREWKNRVMSKEQWFDETQHNADVGASHEFWENRSL